MQGLCLDDSLFVSSSNIQCLHFHLAGAVLFIQEPIKVTPVKKMNQLGVIFTSRLLYIALKNRKKRLWLYIIGLSR